MKICKMCRAEYQGKQCPYCGYREPLVTYSQNAQHKEVKKNSPLVNGCLTAIAVLMGLGLGIFVMLSVMAFQRL